MNRTHKIILIIAGSALFFTMSLMAAGFIIIRSAGWFFTRVVESEPASVTDVGRSIAEYDVPDRFIDAYAVNVADFALVAYRDVDTNSHVYLFQLPETVNLDPVTFEQQLRWAAGMEEAAASVIVQYIPCLIRGQETTLIISDGLTHDNRQYRSATAIFAGKGGQALINISAPAERWDQAMVESFVASLR